MLISVIMGMIATCLIGCSTVENQSSTESGTSSASNAQTSSTQTNDTQSSEETSTQTQQQEAVLYIGREGNFKEYSLKYEGELKPETLIEGISNLTGWDLSLSDAVTTVKVGMTVSFEKDSALFVGAQHCLPEILFRYVKVM